MYTYDRKYNKYLNYIILSRFITKEIYEKCYKIEIIL